jgi:hypothetical protein
MRRRLLVSTTGLALRLALDKTTASTAAGSLSAGRHSVMVMMGDGVGLADEDWVSVDAVRDMGNSPLGPGRRSSR